MFEWQFFSNMCHQRVRNFAYFKYNAQEKYFKTHFNVLERLCFIAFIFSYDAAQVFRILFKSFQSESTLLQMKDSNSCTPMALVGHRNV